ncbi:MAG: hypothetical protein R2761_05700 [Acidimicrobiales bacterium]
MPPTPSSHEPDGQETETSPVENMRRADVVNGENPDEQTNQRSPAAPPPAGSHPAGERQARENRENDPPA